MKRLVFGCAIALPLTLACDPQETSDPSNRAAAAPEPDANPDELAAVPGAHPQGHSDHPDGHDCVGGCAGDCEGHDNGPADAPALHNAAGVGTPLAPSALANVETTDRPVRGGEAAKVQIMVFSDFECPFCAKLLPSLEEALATYGEDVRVTFKQMALPFHTSAEPAARASLAAYQQGKF